MSLDGSDRCIYISTLLSEEEKVQLCQVIQFNADVFAWTHADMPGISPVHASHKLNVTPSARPVRQKVRRFRPPPSHPDRGRQPSIEWIHQSSEIPRVVGQYSGGPKEGEQMKSMCRLHRPQRRLSKRQLPPAPHRSDCGCLGRARHTILPRRFLGISPDPYAPPGCRKNIFHHAPWNVLLQCDAFRIKEYRGHLSEVGNENVLALTRQHYRSLY